MNVSFGIDIGGTKMELLALDEETGAEIFRHRVPTPKNYPDFFSAVLDLIATAKEATQIPNHIGIGIPGIVYPDRTIGDFANNPFVKSTFIEELSEKTGIHVNVANDANCFAVSESTDGAGKDFSNVFCIIIGTGVGGGLVINGKLISGAHSMTGEWGHLGMPFAKGNETENLCGCGTKGCIEANLSGPHLIEEYNKLTGKSITNVKEILEHEQSGEEVAINFMNTFYDRLARALLAPFTLIDPDIIILGGGLSQISDIYTKVPPIFAKYTKKFDKNKDIKINLQPAKFGDSSGVRGAAWLWKSS